MAYIGQVGRAGLAQAKTSGHRSGSKFAPLSSRPIGAGNDINASRRTTGACVPRSAVASSSWKSAMSCSVMTCSRSSEEPYVLGSQTSTQKPPSSRPSAVPPSLQRALEAPRDQVSPNLFASLVAAGDRGWTCHGILLWHTAVCLCWQTQHAPSRQRWQLAFTLSGQCPYGAVNRYRNAWPLLPAVKR